MILPDAPAFVQPHPRPAFPCRLPAAAVMAPERKSACAPAPTPADPAAQARCRIVAEVVEEMLFLIGERPVECRDRRRLMTHARQIAMYVSRVILQISLTDIGIVFARDRTTASYSCHVVEDRRDDPDFDAFVSVIERVITAVFRRGQEHEQVNEQEQADA